MRGQHRCAFVSWGDGVKPESDMQNLGLPRKLLLPSGHHEQHRKSPDTGDRHFIGYLLDMPLSQCHMTILQCLGW